MSRSRQLPLTVYASMPKIKQDEFNQLARTCEPVLKRIAEIALQKSTESVDRQRSRSFAESGDVLAKHSYEFGYQKACEEIINLLTLR